MPKIKTNRAAAKRYAHTGTGKLKRTKANRRHLLANKTKRQKKTARVQDGMVDKSRKREFRKLWIIRINAAARANNVTYSQLINGLKKANININRKMLAEMAVNDAQGFKALVEKITK